MLLTSTVVFLLAIPLGAQQWPPQILEIYRDRLVVGQEAKYRKVEDDAARICGELKCPHPYTDWSP
jgi:hypothetical protein